MDFGGMSFWYIWECLDGQKADFWKISQYVSTYEGHMSTYDGHVSTYVCHVSTYEGHASTHASET